MLESLKEIGRFSLYNRKIYLDQIHAILLENPGNENYKHVVFLNFRKQNGALKFEGITLEPVDQNYLKYLYKRKGSAGANYTPCALVASRGIDGTFKLRFLTWAKSNTDEPGLPGALAEALINETDKILQEIQQKNQTENLANTILTVKIDGQYLGEMEEFIKYFLNAYYQVKSKISSMTGTCSLCGKNGFVMGNEKPWTFYSLDKPGFIASGFNFKNGWKNFPICKECSLLVEEGKQHVEEYLNFRFAGIPYYLMPKSIMGNRAVLEETLLFLEKERLSKLHLADLQNLADDEDDILQFAAEQNDAINYNFLFYESAKAKFTILLYLPDILPSTIKRLFVAKSRVDNLPIFKQAFKEGNELKDVRFTFQNIRTFIKTPKSFLNLVEKIFKRRKIDYYYLLGIFMAFFRIQFANGYYTKPNTLKAWQILQLLNELGILANQIKGEKIMSADIIQNDVKGRVEEFFSQYESTFNSAAKRGIFLTGVLVQFLLRIQQNERGSNPFRKNLKGLKMRQRDILQIFPQAQNKLEEYGKNYYTQLEQVAAEYFVKAGSKWQITEDEINFYFLLGMDLCDAKSEKGEAIFKAEKEEKNNEVETN